MKCPPPSLSGKKTSRAADTKLNFAYMFIIHGNMSLRFQTVDSVDLVSDFVQDHAHAKLQFGTKCWEASQDVKAKHVMFINRKRKER